MKPKWIGNGVQVQPTLPRNWRTHSTGLASTLRELHNIMHLLGLYPPIIPKAQPQPPVIKSFNRK